MKNQQTISLKDLPTMEYGMFHHEVLQLLKNENFHCVNYYAFPYKNILKFICCIADDQHGDFKILSHELPLEGKRQLTSITKDIYSMHVFEREISENFGVDFIYSPWKKPIRYAFNRANRNLKINNYPFYKIDTEELHEVGVGPIHAGVIEPGHFRFLCNGENVLHLEIQLGWQHRGIEELYLSKPSLLQRSILSESIAGDTSVGHGTTFALLMESLSQIKVQKNIHIERTIGLELERIAMHIGDLSNINIGMAYQLGSSVLGALRTPVINFMQKWCGNRFGKSLIRTGGSHFPLTPPLQSDLKNLLDNFSSRFATMSEKMFALPTVLMRMENIGKVTKKQMHLIGAVGMAARMAGLPRDIRKTHPYSAYTENQIPSITLPNGDVWARMMLRKMEIDNSIAYIRILLSLLENLPTKIQKPIGNSGLSLTPNSFTLSVTEGWRGEIVHNAITDEHGKIQHYKVKDPSFHNWMALALSLRDLEISDFPINNKSYNLSYCGHDL